MIPLADRNHEIHEEERRVDIPGEEQPPQINHPVLINRASLFLQDLSARFVAALHGLDAFLGRLLPEDGVVLPQPTLNSIITYLLTFVAIKSQGHPDFPYITHHKSVFAAVICVVMFGFTSAVEHVATRVNQPPLIKIESKGTYMPKLNQFCLDTKGTNIVPSNDIEASQLFFEYYFGFDEANI